MPSIADGEFTHRERALVDGQLALCPWEAYVEAFRSRGWEVMEIERADAHPDGAFVEDTMVVFDGLVVVCRSGARARRGELETCRQAAQQLGLQVAEIVELGTLDGGDLEVITVPTTQVEKLEGCVTCLSVRVRD